MVCNAHNFNTTFITPPPMTPIPLSPVPSTQLCGLFLIISYEQMPPSLDLFFFPVFKVLLLLFLSGVMFI